MAVELEFHMVNQDLAKHLARLIEDYRVGEIPPRTADVVEAWIQQFPSKEQDPLLDALIHVFENTYISRSKMKSFLGELANSRNISKGKDPKEFWKSANLLNIQKGGNSQSDILALFDEVLQRVHNLKAADVGSQDGSFFYLDDCIGTGNRVRHDIAAWLESANLPDEIDLHIITAVLFNGSYWIESKLKETATAKGKNITITKWRLDTFQMENRRAYRNNADVLWPTAIPDDTAVQAYAEQLRRLGHPPTLRSHTAAVPSFYKNSEQKELLERLFLVRGCEIRQDNSYLPDNVRPLGYHNLDCFGFGSLFVTYRNCPNNCPISLWVQQADSVTLLPRKTNRQSAASRA